MRYLPWTRMWVLQDGSCHSCNNWSGNWGQLWCSTLAKKLPLSPSACTLATRPWSNAKNQGMDPPALRMSKRLGHFYQHIIWFNNYIIIQSCINWLGTALNTSENLQLLLVNDPLSTISTKILFLIFRCKRWFIRMLKWTFKTYQQHWQVFCEGACQKCIGKFHGHKTEQEQTQPIFESLFGCHEVLTLVDCLLDWTSCFPQTQTQGQDEI